MPLKRARLKYDITIAWTIAVVCLLVLFLFDAGSAMADCPDLSPSITHDLSESYTELCDSGEVTIRVTYPDRTADLTNLVITEDLGTSGMQYVDDSTSFTVLYDTAPSSANPNIVGNYLIWDLGSYILTARPDEFSPNQYLEIRFQVTRSNADLEELISEDLGVQASIEFETINEIPPFTWCSDTVTHFPQELPLNEPDPDVYKRGRNMDAAQGNWTQTVYGHDKDDVIWRIRIVNNGSADLQDLRFDDEMVSGSMQVNYICPTYGDATAITNNDGVDPGTNCEAFSNTVDDYDVDNILPAMVDVNQGDYTDIFLVGKIEANGSCDAGGPRTNTVRDVQWGCQLDNSPSGAGGIWQTSDGQSPNPAGMSTTLYTHYGDRSSTLTVSRALTGVNTSQPVGSRGTMTIVIRNTTGGTVKNITLADVLPADYVMDPTFVPTVTMDPRYGSYDGMIDTITWTNEDSGNPLLNTSPVFELTSTSTQLPDGYQDVMRDGDELTIVFRVVLIEPTFYDKSADLDVREESTSDGTDPANSSTLTNQLTVEYDTFCTTGETLSFTDNNIPSYPEDLDVDMAGDLIYVLTADPDQTLPLTVNLTNNGGHDAEDYFLYVTFGVTMDVVDVPVGCAVTTNPPPREEWQVPANIPASAEVYECTGTAIAPGATRAFDFGVIKKDADVFPADVAADDLTFRADVAGQINLADGTALTFPTINVPARSDGGTDIANNYSLDGIRARVIGFNLTKDLVGTCSENNPPIVDMFSGRPAERVEIGEECTFHIDTGGWFGFQTPGFTLIAVQDITVWDQLPDGQGYIWSTPDPTTISTPDIQDITLNPPPVAPNEVTPPDYLNWTFNWGDALRITEMDQWFRADLTSRILNDALNNSTAPNVHAAPSTNLLVSTFQAVFVSDITFETVTYTLGPSTVGYPSATVRQVRTTVTEPDITVVKEVCNETLYGNGPTCTNFVPLADDGDAYDSYIYRLTVTNNQESDGYTHSPAYNVTVTDTLDAADLAYVLPFDADGLNNDGDGSTDEAGAGSEGTISDNVVDNAAPAVLTFSYTHSTALERIDAGPANAVKLYYRVDFDDDAAPLQTFTNSAYATYDSLESDYGNQSVPQGATGEAAGARSYTSVADTAAVRILPVETRPKEITALSDTPIVAVGTQGVAVGEEIEYELTTSLPVALLRDFIIRDELPEGLSCVEAPVVDLTNTGPHAAAGFVPGGIITPTCTGDYVEWDFGDQRVTNGAVGTRYDLSTTFIARVENTASTNDGDLLSNGDPATVAYAYYVDEGANPVQYDFGQVDVDVSEPSIVLTKAFAEANADADDVITVTVTAENTGSSTAYNLQVWDNLDGLNLTYAGNVGGANPPDTVDTTTFGANQPVFIWSPANGIPAGDTFTFTFDVLVDNGVQPEEILDNTIQADWTSLPGQTTALNSGGHIGTDGSAMGMRIGALPNAGDSLNDYETTTGTQMTVPAPTLTKDDLNPAVVPTIGARKQFRIEVPLPEGVTNGVVITDNLDATGLSFVLENNAIYDITYAFQNIDTINGQPPSEAALNAFPADGSTGTIEWDIGTVDTASENDAATNAVDPTIIIDYYARINNDLVTDDGDTLQNGAVANYDHGETGAQQTLNDDTPAMTVLEPLLALTKSWSNVTLGKNPTDPPEGGDLLEYELVVLNSGTSTAYDVNVVDTLPATLNFYSGFTTTALINGMPVAGFVATPANAPGGPLNWGHGNGDDSLDIPAGQTLLITYQTVVTAAGGDISNSVMVDWTSLDGSSDVERDGEGCPTVTAPDDYCAGPAVATATTVDNNSIEKNITADTFDTAPWSTADDAVARVGDIITYRLGVNLSGGLTQNLRTSDQMPAGMVFIETVSINGDTTAPYSPPGSGPGSNFSYAPIAAADTPTAGQTGTLTWTIGDVINDPFGDSTTDTIEIVYLARVQPDAGIAHVANTSLTNIVNMDYDTASGPAPTQTDSTTLTVVQPVLTTAKSAVAAGGDTVLAADELITYTVDIVNSGDGPAYDPLLTDTLPVGVRDGVATITTISMELLSGTALPVLDPAYDAATGLVTWTFDTGTADAYTIPAGDTLRIVYQVQADTDLGAGLTLTNQAQVQQYESLDDEDIPTVGSAVGESQTYGPTNVASVTFTTDTPDALVKENPAAGEAAIGELFAYTITVPATPQATALHDVRILDDLTASAADMHFVSVTKISGSEPWTPVNTGTTTQLVIEDTTIGIDIPAGEQVVVEITVTLDDSPTNTDGLTFANTASYTYDQINDDPGTQMPGGSDTTADMTIVAADSLTLEKSGPATVQLGTAATYTLDFHNTSTGRIWNPTITDILPNVADGGMCTAGPSNVTAQIFLADGTTPVSGLLVEGTDFTMDFDGDPVCEWTFTLLSAAGGVAADNRLIITYDLNLDSDTVNGTTLTNVAGVTQWYSADPDVPDGSPRIFTYTPTDGTPGTLDYEDNHTATAEAPVLQFEMSVVNLTTGQDPGSDASPGDTLQYTIEIINSGPVGLSDFTIVDELDDLSATPLFAPGTLTLVSVPVGADTSGTDATGGANGTGLVNIDALAISAQGESNDTIVIVYQVELASAITNGTTVLNQAEIPLSEADPILSDDPNIGGDTDPTATLIASAPAFEVLKTATPMEGDLDVLMAGELLRYTLTIKNIGDENAIQVSLRDYIPANTTYVAGSTTLNGSPVSDPTPGVSPLESGMLLYAPGNPTSGEMLADIDPDALNTATVTFDVRVDSDAMDGLIIENQGFVNGNGEGSGPIPEQPSDDPDTPLPDDPTQIVVGNLPLLYSLKTVEISNDLSSPGIVDPGDTLRYTIVINNFGTIPATGVVLNDDIPANTTYVADSTTLNGMSLGPDGGVSPLVAGLTVQSDDNPGDGIISAGGSAVITFEVLVNGGVAVGTVISNQGSVTSTELPEALTDADGLPSNGFQPTVVVVGDVQLLEITKEVAVVGGGAAEAGGQLEYTIRVTNVGSVSATDVVVFDDLGPPLGDQVTYVDGSGTMNGLADGVTYSGGLLTADYGAQYGAMPPGESIVVRFRVQIDASLPIGTTITNTGVVNWDDPRQSGSASVSLDVGGTPGSITLSGYVWHDANLDMLLNTDTETVLEGWSVSLYRNSEFVNTVLTDADGFYRFTGILPNEDTGNQYEIRFRAAGATPDTPSLGWGDSPFTNGPQRISEIIGASGTNLPDLNLPLWPNGIVYDSVAREPVAGAGLALLNANTGEALPEGCFDDPAQQNQMTALDGFYKFDLNFSDAACPAGGAYLIEVTPPETGYMETPSQVIPPTSDANTAPFSVPECPGNVDDAIVATDQYCEVLSDAGIPPQSVSPSSDETRYYLHLLLNNGLVPGHSQVFNNPIPIDPNLDGAVSITKTCSMVNVSRGDLVPYTITISNIYGAPIYDIGILDHVPPGFKYVAGSARLDGEPAEPDANGRDILWGGISLEVNEKHTLRLLLVVGSGVSEGKFVNRAQAVNTAMNTVVSEEATATVLVVPDPDFDCTDVIGKVFDDRNLNGRMDAGEDGLPGVRAVTAQGLISTSDEYGRFHITCAAIPDEDRGSNFILKLDERSLPSGYRLTTENPRVQRATRGKMMRFNFGAAVHRVVRLDIADGVFEPGTSDMRLQWTPKIDRLLEELKKEPSVLRLSYLGDVERESLVERRLDALKKEISRQWDSSAGGYRLTIETEVYWRRGAPVAGRR